MPRNTTFLAIVLTIILLFTAIPVPAVASQEPTPVDLENKDTNKSSVDLRNYEPSVVATDSASNESIRVVFTVSGDKRSRLSDLRSMGATIEALYANRVQATISLGQLGAYRSKPWIEHVRRPRMAATDIVSEGVDGINASAVHQQGFTGQNITVGVLAVSGFDTSNSEISSNIQAKKSFTLDGISNFGDNQHGTAVAEIVVDTAPNADLYLANFDTGVEYQLAVSWLERQNVDVIVMSASFFEQPHDGTGDISETADTAVKNGTVWVNSAGNARQQHWEGNFTDGDRDGWLNYTSNSETNWLNENQTMQAGDRVSVTLTWNVWPETNQDYDLYLVNASGNTVHRSVRTQDGDDAPSETIDTQVPTDGRYGIAVKRFSATGPHELEIFSYSGDNLSHKVRNSSVASPAAGDRTTSVGAFNYSSRQIEAFSSEGPTNDDDIGVNVAGPDAVTTSAYSGPFIGTSAAAPHVAGTVALILEKNSSLSPQSVEETLEQTAFNRSTSGFDTYHGYGFVDAQAAIQSVAQSSAGGGSGPLFTSVLPGSGGQGPPTNLDSDPKYEDINGDGTGTFDDAIALAFAQTGGLSQAQIDALDFDGDGDIDFNDAIDLAFDPALRS